MWAQNSPSVVQYLRKPGSLPLMLGSARSSLRSLGYSEVSSVPHVARSTRMSFSLSTFSRISRESVILTPPESPVEDRREHGLEFFCYLGLVTLKFVGFLL